MSGWSINHRKGFRDLGEAWFWCHLCPDESALKPGGPTALRKHRRKEHDLDDWPDTETVDAEGFVLTADGDRLMDGDEPVPAPTSKSWITNRPTISRLSRFREGR